MERRCIGGKSGAAGTPGVIVPRVSEIQALGGRAGLGCARACGPGCAGTLPSMTLARVWRRQLLGASTAALIVPSAMLAALLALALGGAFGGVGVLGQLFAGPSLSLGVAGEHAGAGRAGSGPRGLATASLPVIPGVAPAPVVRRSFAGGTRPGQTILTASRGANGAGGAIGGGGTVRPVTLGGGSGG